MSDWPQARRPPPPSPTPKPRSRTTWASVRPPPPASFAGAPDMVRSPLGVVVVGTGFGCVTHVRALRAAGFDVKAVVGRDPARTAERAKRFGVDVACTS